MKAKFCCFTAIARIDRLGQRRPTEGQEISDFDTIAAFLTFTILKQYIVTTLKVGLAFICTNLSPNSSQILLNAIF